MPALAALAWGLGGCAQLPEEVKTAVAPLAAVFSSSDMKRPVSRAKRKRGDEDRVTAEELAVHYAMTVLGKPYRPGGAAPEGFDPSGLVYYSFSRAGAKVPRKFEAQREASERVELGEIRMGDLVYFDLRGRKNSHVGIYIGDGRFVHAASSGRRVRLNRLDTPFWEESLSEARRFAFSPN
jgi:cell wall-associated NlpC family hydrolase